METNLKDAFVLILAYPETVVRVADEWYSKFLPYVGIGRKGYVRAGHAAMVLIKKSTEELEYFDFGRYITPEPFGRVRSAETDAELKFDLKAEIEKDEILNLDELLKVFSTNPKLTHGEGPLIASVCDQINYARTKRYISDLQNQEFVRYGAFIPNASNCVRFVTDALISGSTSEAIRRRLINTKWFTPSSISNVLSANTGKTVYEVSETGCKSEFSSNKFKINARLFFDRLKVESIPEQKETTQRVSNGNLQWLSGIGSGAWFELIDVGDSNIYRFKRISSCGRVDIDGRYQISSTEFDMNKPYRFLHNSNCLYFHVEQNNKVYRFNYLERVAS